MKCPAATIVMLVGLFALGPRVALAARTWTSSGGGFSVEAEFVRLEGDTVYLKRTSDGSPLKVQLGKLSEADQQHARSLAAERAAEKPKKLAVPTGDALANSRKQVAELYADQNVQRIFQDALATQNDPAARFALLVMARDRAAENGNVELMFEIVARTAGFYDIDPLAFKVAGLAPLERAAKSPSEYEKIVDVALELVDEAIPSDRLDEAGEIIAVGEAAARKSSEVARVKEVVERKKELTVLRREFAAAQEALATLKSSPDDPSANFAAGKYYCLYKDDWLRGLPLLAKGADPRLKEIATAELKAPTDAGQQAALGDKWREAAEKSEGAIKEKLLARAEHWYREAAPRLTGIQKIAVEKRLAEREAKEPAEQNERKLNLKTFLGQVEVESAGYGVGDRALIRVNGQTIFGPGGKEPGRGLNVVAVRDGKVVLTRTYDTWDNRDHALQFYADFLAMPRNTFVVVALKDATRQRYNPPVDAALVMIGSRAGLQAKPDRMSYYCIGYKGLIRGKAVEMAAEGLLRYPPTGANSK